MKSKNPIVWDRAPNVDSLVDKLLKETISIEVGDDTFVSSPGKTASEVTDSLKSSGMIPNEAAPVSIEDIPELAKDVCAHIDGKNAEGPVTKYFAKKWSVLKIENPSLYDTLNKGGMGAPGVGKSKAPPGTDWVMNIAGGPQPSIGRGELLFGLLHGLDPGDGGPEDADLKKGSTEYHVKYFADTSKGIKGPTNANSSVYIQQLFQTTPPEESDLFNFIQDSVTEVFGGKGTYNELIDATLDGQSPVDFQDYDKVKAIISWYVANIAKMSLVRGERSDEKYIVLITGNGNFQVENLSSNSLRLPPYPNSQQSSGRITYNFQIGGPAQFAAANYPSLIEASPQSVVQEIIKIEAGESDLEQREIVDIASVIAGSPGLPYSKSLKDALKSAYANRGEEARSYAIGADDLGVNAAWENLLKPLDPSSWPARGEAFIKFLEASNVSNTAKNHVLSQIGSSLTVMEFLSDLNKIKSAVENGVKNKAAMEVILSENKRRSRRLLQLINEELTRSDKKEIEKMIVKRIEADRVQQNKDFQKNLQKELKSSKFQKMILEMAKDEMGRELKGKQLEGAVLEITKKVIKKLYRELSYSYNPVIDRIKL